MVYKPRTTTRIIKNNRRNRFVHSSGRRLGRNLLTRILQIRTTCQPTLAKPRLPWTITQNEIPLLKRGLVLHLMTVLGTSAASTALAAGSCLVSSDSLALKGWLALFLWNICENLDGFCRFNFGIVSSFCCCLRILFKVYLRPPRNPNPYLQHHKTITYLFYP
jgi:hypothetical protein